MWKSSSTSVSGLGRLRPKISALKAPSGKTQRVITYVGYGLIGLLILLLLMKALGYHVRGMFIASNRERYKFDTDNWLPGLDWLHRKPDREKAREKEKERRLKANTPRYLSPLWFPAASAAPGQAPING